MSAWGQVTWDIARSGGFVAYGLLTLAVALGLALSMRWQAPHWPRLINSELHNFVTLLSLVFVVIHVLAVWLDPFTAFGWSEVFIPLVSHYRALWMAFGIVALYLGLALAASVWLRRFIGYEWWRRLHVLTLAVYLLVTVHGLTTGSDTRTVWAAAIYALSVLLIAALLWIRLLTPVGGQQRRHPIWVGVTALALFVSVIATVLGPMRAGWNAFANGGNGSGQRGDTATSLTAEVSGATPTATSVATATALSAPFQAQVSGTMSQTSPDTSGDVEVTVASTLRIAQTGATGTLTIILDGVAQGGDDGSLDVTNTRVSLGPSASDITYRGQLSRVRHDDGGLFMEGVLRPTGGSGSPMGLRLTLQVDSSGHVSGQAQATTGSSKAGSGD